MVPIEAEQAEPIAGREARFTVNGTQNSFVARGIRGPVRAFVYSYSSRELVARVNLDFDKPDVAYILASQPSEGITCAHVGMGACTCACAACVHPPECGVSVCCHHHHRH